MFAVAPANQSFWKLGLIEQNSLQTVQFLGWVMTFSLLWVYGIVWRVVRAAGSFG
jgi:hypothetical protein